MSTVTKSDIVERVKDATGLPRGDSLALVESLLDIVKSSVMGGESLKILGFGTFQVRGKSARKGRNPQTQEALVIRERKVLTFKASLLLRQALNAERNDSGRPVRPRGR